MLLDAAGALQVAEVSRQAAGDELGAKTEDLVLRARTGDAYAFEQLMTLYERQVLCTAARLLRRRDDAKDAAQEVFVKLYRYLPRIKPGARPSATSLISCWTRLCYGEARIPKHRLQESYQCRAIIPKHRRQESYLCRMSRQRARTIDLRTRRRG